MRRRDLLVGAGVAGSGVLLPPFASRLVTDAGEAGFHGSALGTGYRVQFGDTLSPDECARLQAQTKRILAAIDEAMSPFRKDSELARLNASVPGTWLAVGDDTAVTLARAKQVWQRSGGAFDPSVGPLVALWGFGPRGPGTFPSDAEVAAARRRVDASAFDLDPLRRRARRLRDDVRLDLCGIAKGLAVDRIAEALERHGIDRYLVDVGGELRARGERRGGGPWRVAIERLPGQRNGPDRVLALDGRAVATSGDYRSFFMRGGQRYSHCVDPRQGCPVNHGLCAVSVVAEDAMTADALSTALMVLGPDAGLALAERWQVAARLVTRDGNGFREEFSAQFPVHLQT